MPAPAPVRAAGGTPRRALQGRGQHCFAGECERGGLNSDLRPNHLCSWSRLPCFANPFQEVQRGSARKDGDLVQSSAPVLPALPRARRLAPRRCMHRGHVVQRADAHGCRTCAASSMTTTSNCRRSSWRVPTPVRVVHTTCQEGCTACGSHGTELGGARAAGQPWLCARSKADEVLRPAPYRLAPAVCICARTLPSQPLDNQCAAFLAPSGGPGVAAAGPQARSPHLRPCQHLLHCALLPLAFLPGQLPQLLPHRTALVAILAVHCDAGKKSVRRVSAAPTSKQATSEPFHLLRGQQGDARHALPTPNCTTGWQLFVLYGGRRCSGFQRTANHCSHRSGLKHLADPRRQPAGSPSLSSRWLSAFISLRQSLASAELSDCSTRASRLLSSTWAAGGRAGRQH